MKRRNYPTNATATLQSRKQLKSLCKLSKFASLVSGPNANGSAGLISSASIHAPNLMDRTWKLHLHPHLAEPKHSLSTNFWGAIYMYFFFLKYFIHFRKKKKKPRGHFSLIAIFLLVYCPFLCAATSTCFGHDVCVLSFLLLFHWFVIFVLICPLLLIGPQPLTCCVVWFFLEFAARSPPPARCKRRAHYNRHLSNSKPLSTYNSGRLMNFVIFFPPSNVRLSCVAS